jgi:hypothetical protein
VGAIREVAALLVSGSVGTPDVISELLDNAA